MNTSKSFRLMFHSANTYIHFNPQLNFTKQWYSLLSWKTTHHRVWYINNTPHALVHQNAKSIVILPNMAWHACVNRSSIQRPTVSSTWNYMHAILILTKSSVIQNEVIIKFWYLQVLVHCFINVQIFIIDIKIRKTHLSSNYVTQKASIINMEQLICF